MLYHIFYPLANNIKLFNIFKYLTFRTIYAMITALVVCFVLGPWIIRKLESLHPPGYPHRRPRIAPAETGHPDHGGGDNSGRHRHSDPSVG